MHAADSGYESDRNTQSPYWQYLKNVQHFHDSEMRNGKGLVDETGKYLPNFLVRISTGYSSARNFLPVVKFTPMPSNNTNKYFADRSVLA
ncbi:hypothetical protein JTB14_009026 [Gonioctena quinquepunctata]|nr:hypothetical protein JTB14_009026 [Gonioctena quinquepunctata]